MMTPLEETRLFIRQWRTYKQMVADDARYRRLVSDFALIIRHRVAQFGRGK